MHVETAAMTTFCSRTTPISTDEDTGGSHIIVLVKSVEQSTAGY